MAPILEMNRSFVRNKVLFPFITHAESLNMTHASESLSSQRRWTLENMTRKIILCNFKKAGKLLSFPAF